MDQHQLIQQYKNHTGTLPSGAHYIKIGNTLCDVFTGKGWTQPTRYRLMKGQWVYQHGPNRSGTVELNA